MRRPASIMQIQIRHEWQNNGEHGQKKVMNSNRKKPKICPVEALIQIVQIFLCLHCKEINDLPLSIYYNPNTKSIKILPNLLSQTKYENLQRNYTARMIRN